MPNSGINGLVLPPFSDSNKQVAVQFLGELEEYFKLISIFFWITANSSRDKGRVF
jgi:hypothetical protein